MVTLDFTEARVCLQEGGQGIQGLWDGKDVERRVFSEATVLSLARLFHRKRHDTPV